MYDAGSAIFTLTGRVVQEPFDRYGKLVESARTQKEHVIALGAKTVSEGFDKFMSLIGGVQDASKAAAVSVDASMGSIGASTTKMAAGTTRDLSVVQDSLKKTADSFAGVDDSAKATADTVESSSAKMGDSAAAMADEHTAAKDKIVKNNEEIAASSREATTGGGGILGGGKGKGGGDDDPEKQAKKASDAWKAGYSSLATMGKWLTVGIVGVGAVSIKAASDFQKQMEMVHTQAGYSNAEVQALTKSVLDLAPAVGIGPTKLAEGLFHVASSGIPAAKAMDVLKVAAEGARVGNANLEDVTNALVAVMNTAPKDIHSAAEAMGVMNDIVGHGNLRMQDLVGALTTGILPAAKAVGLSFRDVGAAIDTMTARGIPAEEGATRLRTVLGLIADPTTKAQKALDELGFAHDRLAKDFRSEGLVGALTDLKSHMNDVFGHKLDADQMREALTKYANQLIASGVTTATVTKDVAAYHKELEETGDGAVKSSQLIADAFGGARMGTTMQILMQNIGDVNDHLTQLSQPGTAQRFQKDWQDAQKTFSQQVAQVWAGIQKLGIQIGDYLIPKVKAVVMWFVQAAEWLGKNKVAAEALAIAVGGLLTAAFVAFFTKMAIGMGRNIKAFADFGKAIYNLPNKIKAAADAYVARQAEMRAAAEKTTTAMNDQSDAMAAEGEEGAGGAAVAGGGGLVEGVEEDSGLGGAILGMIEGVKGPEAPGSIMNPLAVVIMAAEEFGLSGQAAASGEKTESEAAAETGGKGGGAVVPAETKPTPDQVGAEESAAPERAATAAAPLEEEAGQAGMMAGVVGAAGTVGSRLLRGAGIAGIGLIGSQLAGQAIGGKAGSAVSSIGTGASLGAAIGTVIEPGIGTAIGAGLGAVGSALEHFLGGSGKTYGQQVVGNLTKGFGTTDMRKQAASLLDQAAALNHPQARGGPGNRFVTPGVESQADITKAEADQFKAGQDIAKQLEAGWSQYKFQSEPVMFGQMKAEIKGLPPAAQAGGIESALAFAKGLEKQGKLAPGSVNDMLDGIKAEFPGFEKYLGLQGSVSANTFFKALNFKNTQTQVANQLKAIAGDFPQVQAVMEETGLTVQQKSAGVVLALQGIIDNGTGPMKKQATADMQSLQAAVGNSMTKATAMVIAQTADMQTALDNGSQNALKTVTKNFSTLIGNIQTDMQDGTVTVQQGSKLINQLLTQELEAFGVKVPKSLGLSNSSLEGLLKGGKGMSGPNPGNRLAGGGMLPGSEYGLGDVMTLVDPQGNPRAKMAGDEAVFNRHQMPYVEAGLQAIGFGGADHLWNSVSTPHGYAGGGHLGHQGGGNSSSTGDAPTARQVKGSDNAPGGSVVGTGGVSGAALKALQEKSDYHYEQERPFPGSLFGAIPRDIDCSAFAILSYKTAGAPSPSASGYTGYGFTGDMIGRGTRVAQGKPGDLAFFGDSASQTKHVNVVVGNGLSVSMGQPGDPSIGPTAQMGPPGFLGIYRYPGGEGKGSWVASASDAEGGSTVQQMWKKLKAPKVKGSGALASIVQGALNQMTGAANKAGEAATAASGVGGMPNVTLSGPIPRQVQQFFSAAGFNKTAIAGILGNSTQESSNDPNAPGGGMWQQISNFGSGTGGSLLHQMQIMLPQIQHLKAAMNAAKTPGEAAVIFEQGFEKAGIPDMGNRIAGAQAAFRAGYAGGGRLPGFASGGKHKNPWSPLPTGTGYIPGYRPIRVRRSRSGLHVVGGTTGGSKGVSGSKGKGTSAGSKPKTQTRKTQTLSQTVATTLDALGLGTFVQDQNELGILDTKYTDQENLYDLYDQTSGNGLPLEDLETLMGIREQEWDILYKEYTTLPAAIAKLKKTTAKTVGRATHRTSGTYATPGGQFHFEGATIPGYGAAGMEQEITQTEQEITDLDRQVTLDTRAAAKVRHNISAASMSLADNYASGVAGFLSNLNAIHTQRYTISVKKNNLSQQLSALSTTSTPTAGTVVSTVLTGGSTSTAGAKKKIRNERNALQKQDLALQQASYNVRQQMKKLLTAKQADARRLKAQGFDEAWILSLKKWKIQDKIYQLKLTLTKLKASYKVEDTKGKADTTALTTVENWMSGGLQGTSSIQESLEGIAYDMLDLVQQGAPLPGPGRKEPTLQTVEDFLTKIGITLPPGLAQGTYAADQSYADFQAFQQSRSDLFSAYGSNFVGAGAPFMAGSAGVGAGAQYFGAAAGPSAGGGAMAQGGWIPGQSGPLGPGDTTINIHQNFAAGPPDPHTYSAGLMHEMRAQV